MDHIYHLTTDAAWAEGQAAGAYRAASLEAEGFIHASTAGQAEGSANRFFGGRPSVVVLTIHLGRVVAPVRWERSAHSAEPFPHLYGPLNLDAVVDVVPWDRSADGSFRWPPAGLIA